MTCFQFTDLVNKSLVTLHLKRKPRKHLEISNPFDFKQGPAVNFPGYSEDDISLMREKAIASTAIVDDGDVDADFSLLTWVQRQRSRASSSQGCGFGSRVCYHARRVSRGCIH